MQSMLEALAAYAEKPELYAQGGDSIWSDEHISQGLLQAHLDPDVDAASRRPAFIDRSVKWLARIAPPARFASLLDLGCGPGLYAERFCDAGYSVVGVDLSPRSIAYARARAAEKHSDVQYLCQNYLTLDYDERFDLVTLIYCDYAALPKRDRQALLRIVYRALKPGGMFVFDVFTPKLRKPEGRSWCFYAEGGFWSPKPHLCLNSVYQYDDEDRIELRQTLVCADGAVKCYNVWDHFFTREALQAELAPVGFGELAFYGDVAGADFSPSGETICCVLTK